MGIFNWMIEIGYIYLESGASQVAQYWYLPREKHLMALVQFFAYINNHLISRITFDPKNNGFCDKGFV